MEVGHCKIGAIIQARLGSSRLPNKVLLPLPIGSKNTIISQILSQLNKVSLISKVIVATSKSEINDKLENYLKSLQVTCYRGDEDDVLSRFYNIARNNDFDFIIRLTADNPVLDIKYFEEFIKNCIKKDLDYSYSKNLPLGCNFEIVRASKLIESYNLVTSKYEREHVTPYVKKYSEKSEFYKFENIDYEDNLRLTIDYPSDYAFLNMVFSFLGTKEISLNNINNLLNLKPWLLEINKKSHQKREWLNLEEEIEEILLISKTLEMNRITKVLEDVKKNSL